MYCSELQTAILDRMSFLVLEEEGGGGGGGGGFA